MIDNCLKLDATYENKALRILLKEFRKMSAKISFDALTKANAEAIIPFAIDEKAMQEALFKVHYTIGKSYGNLEARKLRQEIKKFKPLPLFNVAFMNFLLAYYAEFGGEEIKLLTATYITAIVEEIRKATYENETVLQMRDRIYKTVNSPNFYKWQALRIARTETTFAMNRAKLISGEVSGLTMEKYWIAKIDSRTRDIHAYMNGKKVGQNELFDVDGEKMLHPGDRTNGASARNLVNCYLPGSIISSNIIEGQRSFYSGKAIEIVTRGGKRISITPNHKILTKNGFVAAKDINIGDNLLCNKVNTNGIVRFVNNYINKKFFTVENVFSTLQKFWSSKHLVVSSLDFDKDGESMNGNIDIVYPKIKLVNSVKPISDECINYFFFIKTFFKRIFISGFSPLNFFSGRNQTTSTRFMSFLYLAFPSCFIHFRPLKNFALGLGSTINPQRFKLSGERNSGDTEFLFQLIKTHSRIIEFDDVVDVRNFTYVGHVYDFTSYSGTNIVNNIYTSNCRCTFGYRAKRDSNGQLIWND